jgi:hypothetical protein
VGRLPRVLASCAGRCSVDGFVPVGGGGRKDSAGADSSGAGSDEMERVQVPGRRGWRDATQDQDAIAIGRYASDLHGCPGASDPEEPVESAIQDGRSSPYRVGPFSVPSGVLVPETVDGLVVAEKNLSTTRAVGGAVRLQPIAFATGSAAGVTAGLAAARGVAPRSVPVLDVQWRVASRWDSDLSIQPWLDARPTTVEQAFLEVAVTRGWQSEPGVDRAGHGWSITRGEAVEVLAQAKGLTRAPRSVFDDIGGNRGRWLSAAKADGWFSGCGASKSCAGDRLTRQQFAWIASALDGTSPGPRPSDVAGSAAGPAGSAVAKGFLTWCGVASQKFCPAAKADRASIGRLGAALLNERTT